MEHHFILASFSQAFTDCKIDHLMRNRDDMMTDSTDQLLKGLEQKPLKSLLARVVQTPEDIDADR